MSKCTSMCWVRGGATLGVGVAVGSLLGYWVCRGMQTRTRQAAGAAATCACGGGDVDAASAAATCACGGGGVDAASAAATCACGGGDVDAARAAIAASKPLLNPGLHRSTPHARALLAAGGRHDATVADEELISHCYKIRDQMRAPAHSNFRVVAILTVTLAMGGKGSGDPPKLCHVVGTNHEIGIIGAGRAAVRPRMSQS